MNPGDTATVERTFTQSDFDRFAALSGDANPIHVDPGFAARSRFGKTVAHGLLLLTALREVMERLAPDSRMIRHSIVFPAPTFADETMRLTVECTAVDGADATVRFRAARAGDGTVTGEGEAVLALPDGIIADRLP